MNGTGGGPPVLHAPARSRVDEPFWWRVDGLPPSSPVTVRARAVDGALVPWCSENVLISRADGTLDGSRDVPVSGVCTEADAGAVLWSMLPESSGPSVFFAKTEPTPVHYTLDVEVDGVVRASLEVVRHFGRDEVDEQVLSAPGPVGRLYRPSGAEGGSPPVVVWAGSDGGRLDHAAVLLAAQGFCVLSLGVFGVEDRPRGLVGIELDWVDEAIRRLLEHPWSAGGSVALVSLSRGAELALQVAADNPRVGAVCAGSPSSLRQAGIVPGSMDFSKAAWLRSGDELPFMVGRTGPRDWLQMAGVFVLRRPMRQLEQFRRARRDHEAVARATIPVERARARLMLVVGEQDQLWPSAEYAEDVVERLRSHGWDGVVETVSFPEAGHFVSFPYALPTLPPMVRLAPSQAFRMDFGGSPRANAAAATASWSRLVHFLRDGETGDEPPRTTTSQEQT